jgi:hypothetical protein
VTGRLHYNRGYVHKIITLGTPHFGTPQAILSILPQTACSRNLAATQGSLFFSSASLLGNASIPGAAGELQGDGIGTNLSSALQTIQSQAPPTPVATIAGDTGPIEYEISSALVSEITVYHCQGTGDVLAADYTTAGFENIFDPTITPNNPVGTGAGRRSDGSVPVTSAMRNSAILDILSCPTGQCFPSYTHSSGIAVFFGLFGVDYLQDGSNVVAQEVENLLNTSIHSQVFGGTNP